MDAIVFMVILSVLAMFGILVAGGVSMVRGGRFDMLHSFPLMEARVVLGIVTLELILVALFLL